MAISASDARAVDSRPVDARIVEVEGVASIGAGGSIAALSQALGAAGKALGAAGLGPHHQVAIAWEGPEPGALHPSRRAVDRVWREAFGGFRPPPTVRRSADDCVRVRVTARRPDAPPPAGALWQGYDFAELARQMSPRNQVADMQAEFHKWTVEGEAARNAFRALNIAYGPHRDEVFDLYRPAGAKKRPPVWVFIHGGYWQASSKDQHAQFCHGMLGAGFAVVNLEYPLAPEAPLARIVDHIRSALHFLVREQDALDIDASDMHVAGHSAGGHLAAMMASDDTAPPLRSATLLSGVLDIEPLKFLPMGPPLGVAAASPDEIRRLSPVHRKRRAGTRIAVSLGGLESDEFKRQSAQIAKLWNGEGPLIVPGRHHFDLLDDLNSGPLLELILRAAGR